uniref:Midnolin n=1 Tax=Cuerna arida TaxID=1464854 RepID=A0A1B6GT64_9HEMI
MQALESLNDSQVNDFLSGKAPLNLTMRLGDHMMLIQLQLSTVTPSSSSGSSSSSKRSSNFKSVPSTSGKHLTKSLGTSDPLASLTSIVNKSIEGPSTKLREKQIAAKRNSFLALLDSQKPEPEVSSCLPEESIKSSEETVTSFVPVAKVESSDSGVSMDVDSAVVKSLAENAVTGGACKCDSSSSQRAGVSTTKPMLDTRALAEASRNLTQTLKQLSSEVLTSKTDPIEDAIGSKRRQGAIIESMHHHGKGVYSGTFSGTLNPALQDRFGRPKRDISTIIHILNDLLCATPQYRNSRPGTLSPLSPEKPLPAPTSTQTTSTQTHTGDILSPACASTAVSDSVENQATRDKMERLRLIMEERRERRRAARSRPYPRTLTPTRKHTQWSAKSETQLPMDTELCAQPDVTPEPVIA